MQKSDEEIINNYFSGDESAFAFLVDRYLKPVYNFIYHFTGSLEYAEDGTQETFLKVWKNLKKYKNGGSVKAWIFSIARNTSIDFLRKKKMKNFSDFEDDESEENFLENTISDLEMLPDEVFAKAEEKKFVENILGELPYFYKEILLFYYQDNLTFDEIGKILGESINTVKSRHRRAIIKLKEMFNAPK